MKAAVAPLPAEGPVIELRNLSHTFGDVLALRRVSFGLDRGQRLVLLGPNGAGKTTLIRILGTLLKPTSGEVCIAGYDVSRDAMAVRRHIGVAAHQTYLYPNLTARENLIFYASLYDVPDPAERADELLDRLGLFSRRHELVRRLSRGMQQRAALARALVHNPSILLLDEPDTGLDPEGFRAFQQLLDQEASSRTVVMTTHNFERGIALSHRVGLLVAGKLVYEGEAGTLSPEALAATYQGPTKVPV